MVRQKWVDVWDGEKYIPQEQVAAAAAAAAAASTAAAPPTTAPATTAPAATGTATPITAPLNDHGSSTKFIGEDEVQNKDLEVGQSIATEDEPTIPPPAHGSTTHDVNNSPELTKTSLLTDTGDDKHKETGDTHSHISSKVQGTEPLDTELLSDKDKLKEGNNSTVQVDLNSDGAKAMIRGLHNSRWAGGNAKDTEQRYPTPAPPRASASGPTQQAIDVAPNSQAAETRNSAMDLTKQHIDAEKQAEEAVPVEVANESDDKSFAGTAAKVKKEDSEGQRSKGEAQDSPQIQHRDTWQSWKSDSESRPGLGQTLDEDNQPASAKSPSKAEATPVALTHGALCAEFGSCPADRSDTPDPMSRVSATGIENAEQSALVVSRDPRGESPEEQLPAQDWNETRRPKPKKFWESDSFSSDDVFYLPTPLKKLVVWWMAAIPEMKSDFLKRQVPNHHLCDIDPLTGKLIEPIDYPQTSRPVGGDWASLNRTAQDVINQAMLHLRRAADRANRLKSKRSEATREAAMSREMAEETAAREVKVECHLRPATLNDMEEVTAIYNREVKESTNVVDTEPIPAAKFRTLLQVCNTLQQPFVVAVEGWHFPDIDASNRRILGFSFVDTSDKGIIGSRATSTMTRGKITLIVHPDFRQKKIGTALLDVIVNCCSTIHSPREGYQWVCDPNDTIHMSPPHSPRKWLLVQMEVLVKTKKSKEEVLQHEKWLVDFLEEKFLLLLTKHDDHFGYRPHPEVGEGPQGWVDRLTFEHRCRPYNTVALDSF